jgi:hypothetical protein
LAAELARLLFKSKTAGARAPRTHARLEKQPVDPSRERDKSRFFFQQQSPQPSFFATLSSRESLIISLCSLRRLGKQSREKRPLEFSISQWVPLTSSHRAQECHLGDFILVSVGCASVIHAPPAQVQQQQRVFALSI